MSDTTTQGAVPASNLIRRELLDEKAAAELLDIAPGTLSVWRSTGRYRILFVKAGRRGIGARRPRADAPNDVPSKEGESYLSIPFERIMRESNPLWGVRSSRLPASSGLLPQII